MKKTTCRISAALAALLLNQALPQQAGANPCELTIGVSLHPYYSWVKNIVGDAAEVTTLIPPDVDPHTYQPTAADMARLEGLDAAEVTTLIPPDVDPHTYQPTAADMARLEGLDAVVVNGVGHDEFITPMLKAIDNPMLHVLDTSKGLPLIPAFNDRHYAFEEKEGGDAAKVAYNSHTYIAVTGAIQQMQMLNRELGKLCPEQAAQFSANLRDYAAKLRNMLQETLSRIQGLKLDSLRIATVHDGYSYLFQELGIEVSAVVQPRHGITPSSKQLQDTIKRIKQANVSILFGEMDYEKKYVDIIFQETGCRLYALSHISNGEYSKEHFEQTMKKNMDIIVHALTEAAARSGAAAAPVSVQDVMNQQMQDTAKKMQESMQQAVPEIQQKQMDEQMRKAAEQVQGAMQQNVQQAVPAMQQQQMQDAAKQMQEKMQQQMQNAVPSIQQEQMSKAMSQQAQQVQESMQQNVQQAVPAMQQQQMQDAAKQMQEKMQQQMQNAVPSIQQEQMSKVMSQQAQQVQGAMQQNVQQAVPAVQQQQMQGAAKQMQEKMQQAVPEIQQKQMSEQMQKAVQQVQDSLKQNPPPAAPPQAKP